MAENPYVEYADEEARKYGVPPALVRSVAQNESGWNPNAVSKTGNRGIMQLGPDVIKQYGEDPNDPRQNIDMGVRYLAENLSRYKDPFTAALAYHQGPGNVDRGTIGPQGMQYATKVMDAYKGGGQVHPQAQAQTPPPAPNLIKGANPEYGLAGMTREQLLASFEAIENGPEAQRAGELAKLESDAYVEAAEMRKELLPEFKKIQQARIENFKKRPNTPQYDQIKAEQLPEIRDPARALTQFLPMLALISGAFNKKYAMSAIQGITAAANAQKEGDYQRRQMAHESYMDDLKRTVENNSIKANQYQALIDDVNLTDNEFKAQAEALASQWGESEQLAADYGKGREAMQKRVDMLVKTMSPIARVVQAMDSHKGDQIFRGDDNQEYIYDKENRSLINASTKEPVVGKWPRLTPLAQRPLTALQDAYQSFIAEGTNPSRPFGPTASERAQWVSNQAGQTSADRYWDAQGGSKQLQSFNATIAHIGLYKEAIKELNNGPLPAANRVRQQIEYETGKSNVTDVGAMKGIVADEIAKAVLGGPGAVHDREELQKQLSSVNSPEQLQGVVDKFLKLMSGQVRAAQKNFLSTTRRSNDAFSGRLLPETIEAMQEVGEDPTVPPKEYKAGDTPAPEKPKPASGGSWRQVTAQEMSELDKQGKLAHDALNKPVVYWGGQWVYADTGKPFGK